MRANARKVYIVIGLYPFSEPDALEIYWDTNQTEHSYRVDQLRYESYKIREYVHDCPSRHVIIFTHRIDAGVTEIISVLYDELDSYLHDIKKQGVNGVVFYPSAEFRCGYYFSEFSPAAAGADANTRQGKPPLSKNELYAIRDGWVIKNKQNVDKI